MKTSIRLVLAVGFTLMLLVAVLIALKRPGRALAVATANVAQTLCADVFVSALAPDRVFDGSIVRLVTDVIAAVP